MAAMALMVSAGKTASDGRRRQRWRSRSIRRRPIARLELSAAEHRAFMAEQREIIAGLLRQVEDLKATVKDGKDGRDGVRRQGWRRRPGWH
jgi:hypothetical protein